MNLIDLAQAAQTHSDNGAANLLLRRLGGPAAFTAWLRTQVMHRPASTAWAE